MTEAERKTAQKRLLDGDAEAFGALYAELAVPLYRFALSTLGNETDAEDAVQEACLSAFKNRRSLKKAESFKSWLFAITANRCRDVLRARARVVPTDPEDGALQGESYETPFGDGAALLGCLNDTDRQIVTLSVLGNYTGEEIGHILGMKAGTVRSRLSRALKTCRKEWETEYGKGL